MIKMATKDLTAGMVTAAPVYSKTGQRLFDANTMLTSQKISYLEFYGVEWVQVLPEAEIEEPEIPDAPCLLAGRRRGTIYRPGNR